jgi:hypothetical protein
LKLLEGFSLFGYQEYYKNLLCILVEAYRTIYGINTTVLKKLMDVFDLISQKVTGHMMKRHKYTSPDFQHSYRIICNQTKPIIHNTVTQPVQFPLGSLPTMSSFTQKLGAGWERINKDNFCHNVRMDVLQKLAMMTISHQYKEAYIQLMTMRFIKVVQTKLNKKIFSI